MINSIIDISKFLIKIFSEQRKYPKWCFLSSDEIEILRENSIIKSLKIIDQNNIYLDSEMRYSNQDKISCQLEFNPISKKIFVKSTVTNNPISESEKITSNIFIVGNLTDKFILNLLDKYHCKFDLKHDYYLVHTQNNFTDIYELQKAIDKLIYCSSDLEEYLTCSNISNF